jgi:5-methylcytosine-specific restriction endonuclease McrA
MNKQYIGSDFDDFLKEEGVAVTFELNGKRYPWFHRMPEDQWREIKQYVYQLDLGLCQYCEQPVKFEECHTHHVLELSQGGTNHPSNLKTLHKKCHKDRHPFMKTSQEKLHDSS